MDFDELLLEIRELRRQLDSVVRLGEVTDVRAAERVVRVEYKDREEAESNWLPVLPETLPNKEDLVVVLSLPQGLADGVVLGVIETITEQAAKLLRMVVS